MATRELELCPPEGLDDGVLVLVVGPDRHKGLANVDAGDGSLGLAEGAPHSGLQPIGASARQHFVDAEDVEGVDQVAKVLVQAGARRAVKDLVSLA